MQIMLCRAVAREDSFGTAADATESRWLERGKCRDSRGVDTGLEEIGQKKSVLVNYSNLPIRRHGVPLSSLPF